MEDVSPERRAISPDYAFSGGMLESIFPRENLITGHLYSELFLSVGRRERRIKILLR